MNLASFVFLQHGDHLFTYQIMIKPNNEIVFTYKEVPDFVRWTHRPYGGIKAGIADAFQVGQEVHEYQSVNVNIDKVIKSPIFLQTCQTQQDH